VKLSTLLEVIGSGSMLLLAGVVMFLLGIGYGFSELAHLPLWVCLCGLGVFAAIVGFALVDRGTEEAEQQVKHFPLAGEVSHSPLIAVGALFLGGLFLERLLRRRPKVVVAEIVSPHAKPEGAIPSVATAPHEDKDDVGLSHFVGEQLRSLGSLAAATGVAIAWQEVGVPVLRRLLENMLGSETQKEKPARVQARSEEWVGTAASRESPGVPSHNGAHR
jgi:hypothetical protein